MTKEEKLAFEYGRTYKPLNEDKSKLAVCYDERMDKLVSNTRTERGYKRNTRNMTAWYKGLAEQLNDNNVEYWTQWDE